jgi:hypothetical protein
MQNSNEWLKLKIIIIIKLKDEYPKLTLFIVLVYFFKSDKISRTITHK